MKRFADYPVEIRAKALVEARERHGLLAWNRMFDQNDEKILALCEEISKQ